MLVCSDVDVTSIGRFGIIVERLTKTKEERKEERDMRKSASGQNTTTCTEILVMITIAIISENDIDKDKYSDKGNDNKSLVLCGGKRDM